MLEEKTLHMPHVPKNWMCKDVSIHYLAEMKTLKVILKRLKVMKIRKITRLLMKALPQIPLKLQKEDSSVDL
jgi:hypothetical protein